MQRFPGSGAGAAAVESSAGDDESASTLFRSWKVITAVALVAVFVVVVVGLVLRIRVKHCLKRRRVHDQESARALRPGVVTIKPAPAAAAPTATTTTTEQPHRPSAGAAHSAPDSSKREASKRAEAVDVTDVP
eukprot:m51a1_g1814 hypothetical protein (133) ;mRNA; f:488452-488931